MTDKYNKKILCFYATMVTLFAPDFGRCAKDVVLGWLIYRKYLELDWLILLF